MKKKDVISLEQMLGRDETILWQGQPEQMKVMEKPYGMLLILRWLICSALAIAVLYYWLVLSVRLGLPAGRSGVISVFLLGLFVYLCMAPLFARDNLEKKTRYCITNKRVIVYHLDSTALLTREWKDVTEVHVHKLATGLSDLVIGPYDSFIKRHMRADMRSFVGKWQSSPIPLASILDVAAACAVLPGHVVVHGDTPVPDGNLDRAA